jgi:GINS complex subunit 3
MILTPFSPMQRYVRTQAELKLIHGPSAADTLQKVPSKFELDVPNLGYLDNTPTQPLRAGTQLNLPLWLAEMLALATASGEDSRPPVTLNLPSALSDQVVQALKADPRAVPLRDQSAHFYALGTRMLDLFEEKELGAVLRKTFVVRAGDVGLHARKAGEDSVGGGGEEFLRGLDEWERLLFRRAHDAGKSAREWAEHVKKH